MYDLPKGGNLPVRLQGSRWINHKCKALQRIVDRYGMYMNHLATLGEDTTTSSADRARLKSFLKKWKQSKMLVGVAMYLDVLKPPSVLSLSLQDENLDTVGGIKNILKSSKSQKSLAEQDPIEWPTIKLVCSRIQEEDGDKVYQGTVLHEYNTTVLHSCAKHVLSDLHQLEDKIRSRLEWSDVEMLR